MNRYLLLPLLLIISLKISAQPAPEASVMFPGKQCLNETEQKMALALNQYRKSRGLKPIPVSASLSWVARVHVEDLKANYVYGSSCNLHSWSENNVWSSCCYKSDHKMAQCMWDKPRELSQYKGDGFEIAFYSTYDYPDADSFVAEALNGWKTSRGHHDIIANRGKWATAKFEAMGVGANDEFIVVWFGEMTDLAGPPENCR